MPSPRAKRSDCNYVLYVITCLVTEERYLGLTCPKGRAYKRAVKIRLGKHFSRAKMETEKTRGWGLYDAIRAYGEENFRAEVLEIVRGKEQAFAREAFLINEQKFALNTKKKK